MSCPVRMEHGYKPSTNQKENEKRLSRLLSDNNISYKIEGVSTIDEPLFKWHFDKRYYTQHQVFQLIKEYKRSDGVCASCRLSKKLIQQ